MLASLGITDLVKQTARERKKPAKPKAPKPAALPVASRSSGRLSSKKPVSYVAERVILDSDDEGDEDEEEGDDDDDASGGSDDDDDEEEEDMKEGGEEGEASTSARGGGGGGGRKKGGKAKPAAGKAKAKPAASGGGGGGKKVLKSRGGVPPGGRGFVCPTPGCGLVFEDAPGALAHAKAEHGVEGREVDADGTSPCLWDGCTVRVGVLRGSQKKADGTPALKWGNLLSHEASHEARDPPRGFLCPTCDEAFETSDAAWEHAEGCGEGCERDPKRCLYDGCGLVFRQPNVYRRHEPVHTGVWPFYCACGKGFRQEGARRRVEPRSPRPPPPRLPALPARSVAPTFVPDLGSADWARDCCRVTAACKCGWQSKGKNGPSAPPLLPPLPPRDRLRGRTSLERRPRPRLVAECATGRLAGLFKEHQRRCKRGAAPLPPS